MDSSENSTMNQLDAITKEIREIRRDLYGNPQIKQAGVFDRLERLEDRLSDLRTTYEKEKIEQGYVAGLETRLDDLALKYATALIYLKGIAGGVAAIVVPLFIAAVLFAFRFFGGV